MLATCYATGAAMRELLGMSADDRNIARSAASAAARQQLQVCAKCRTAKFCSREAARYSASQRTRVM
jgi:hypothetical protein